MTTKLGFGEGRDENICYLQVKYYGLCEVSKIEREGYEPVEVRNPQTGAMTTKYVKRHPSITAFVDDIEWRDTGDKYDIQFLSWRLHLNAGEFKAILEIDFRSAASGKFMKTVESVDWTKPVEFRAFKEANKANATAFIIAQDGEFIHQRYTVEKPGDMPLGIKGIGGWNYSAQEAFLWGRMNDIVIPACAAAAAARKAESGSEDNQHPADPAPGNPAEQPESSETTRWTPPSTAKPAETATAPATQTKEAPSELAGIVTKVKMLAAGKGIPNLDAFIKAVLTKDTPAMATVAEANEVLAQLKAL